MVGRAGEARRSGLRPSAAEMAVQGLHAGSGTYGRSLRGEAGGNGDDLHLVGAGGVSELKTAYPGLIWVIEVEWKRRKGNPVEAVGITTGGMLHAMLMAKGIAEKLKIPQSWVKPVLYRKCKDQEA